MTRICCLVFARLASTRVPNKLLQEVGGRSLLDRGLDYLVRLRDACPSVTPVVCHPRSDRAIEDGCHDRDIESWIDATTDAKSWPELIEPLVDELRSEFDWVWDANVFCHPFLRVETGQAIVKHIETAGQPFVVTREKRGVVWSGGRKVCGYGELANTKTNTPYQELAHIAYCWPNSLFGETTHKLALFVEPFPMNLHWSELIDIDTPEDLEHARAVAAYVDGPTDLDGHSQTRWYCVPISELFPGQK